MAMGKSYKIWHKINGQGPYSVLLEQRNRDEALLFESLVIAGLGKVDVLCKLHSVFNIFLQFNQVLLRLK